MATLKHYIPCLIFKRKELKVWTLKHYIPSPIQNSKVPRILTLKHYIPSLIRINEVPRLFLSQIGTMWSAVAASALLRFDTESFLLKVCTGRSASDAQILRDYQVMTWWSALHSGRVLNRQVWVWSLVFAIFSKFHVWMRTLWYNGTFWLESPVGPQGPEKVRGKAAISGSLNKKLEFVKAKLLGALNENIMDLCNSLIGGTLRCPRAHWIVLEKLGGLRRASSNSQSQTVAYIRCCG